jgi:hypothetical protein
LAALLGCTAGTCRAQEALMGMRIEKVDRGGAGIAVTTTGAEFVLEKESDLRCFQRIPIRREVARVELPREVLPLSLEESTDFSCTIAGSGIRLKVQGDSLVILVADKDLAVNFKGLFKPAYHASKEGKWLLIDGTGGFGIFPVEAKAAGKPDFQLDAWTIEHPMHRGDETWVSVFPPRPYDWKRAYSELAAHEGNSGKYAFPSDALIRSTAERCKVLVVHSWFWPGGDRDPWMIPRYAFKDDAEREKFDHVRDEAHRAGMKLIPYFSPFYYSGPDFFAEVRRALDEYKVDGLYYDGIRGDFRAAYQVVRKTRRMLGDDRLLFRHCTSDPLGSNRIYCPFIDTYCDFIYRGEAGRGGLELDDFLRWTISGYNISNAVGYWVYTGSTGKPGYVRQVPGKEDIDAAIRCEVRIPRTEVGYELGLAWEPGDGHLVFFDDYYYRELASIGERLEKAIGLDGFARYPGTPAQFLRSGKPGEQR